MEIYRNSTDARVTLLAPETVIPEDDTIDIKAVNYKGEVIYEFAQTVRTADGFAVQLPWSLTREDSQFYITWTFDYMEGSVLKTVEEKTEVVIVTPILSLAEVQHFSGLTEEADIIDLERRVRFAIQTYTGTTFGRFKGTIPITGTGDSKLNLPLPLLRIESPIGLRIYGGGWAVGAPVGGYSGGIKTAPPEEILDQFFASAGPIMAPLTYRSIWFRDDVTYNITGVWGYNDVPADVQQAARLLVADYACDESLWRDRYIDAIRAGDWRIDFNGEAFSGTGNVAADQILATYRRTSLVII